MQENLTLQADNKGTDQPVHQHSLVSTFVVHYLEIIVVKLASCVISIGVAKSLKNIHTSKGRLLYQDEIFYNYVPFQIGPSLKGKNLLPKGANYFL